MMRILDRLEEWLGQGREHTAQLHTLERWREELLAGDPALARMQQSDSVTLALAALPWAVLIGPEGGFSPAERARLYAMPQALAVSLGPRTLRADTAAIAALSLWQSVFGDWARAPVYNRNYNIDR